jgi:hypothetical protein
MNFKFLKSLSDQEAGDFFQGLLWKLGDATNDDEFGPVIDHIYEWQIKAYTGKSKWQYQDWPFTPLRKPITDAKIGLMTTSGHFVEGDDPEPFGIRDMSAQEAQDRISDFLREEPALSAIPIETPRTKLRLRHGGYDNRAAIKDFNTVLPLDRLGALRDAGFIGQIAENAYSFVGACAQRKLVNETSPQWVEVIKRDGIDAMILVPV